MARKLTQEEFESRIFNIFGDEYTVLGKYINKRTNILVRHNKCGEEYLVKADNLLMGKGHFKCNGNRTKTTEEFKTEVFNLFNSEYEVVGEYKNNRTKILMKHINCGKIYKQTPKDIVVNKSGCPYCGGTRKLTDDEFQARFNDISNDEYECLDEYKSMRVKIRIKHLKCGNIFKMNPVEFLSGQGCPDCRYEKTTKTHEEFLKELKEVHGNNFEVLEEYKNSYTKINVKCNKCGIVYKKNPNGLLKGYGCLNCTPINTSKGVSNIENYLIENNIKYLKEYIFDDCKHNGHLRFDFALFDNDNNLICLIEFDGEQHYRAVDFFGGKDKFKDTQTKDEIKNNYCEKNNIKLIRISYKDENNINNILKLELN